MFKIYKIDIAEMDRIIKTWNEETWLVTSS